MCDVDKLRLLTGEHDEILLSLLLEEAEEFVLSYTRRTKLVPGLKECERSGCDCLQPHGNRRREQPKWRRRVVQFRFGAKADL